MIEPYVELHECTECHQFADELHPYDLTVSEDLICRKCAEKHFEAELEENHR